MPLPGYRTLKERSPLGIKAQSYVDRGELVPDQLLLDIMEERLSQPDAQSGWILDGFPRNVNQASFLEQLLQKLTQDSVRAINLDVPDEVLVSRLLGRGRADDTEEVMAGTGRLSTPPEPPSPTRSGPPGPSGLRQTPPRPPWTRPLWATPALWAILMFQAWSADASMRETREAA